MNLHNVHHALSVKDANLAHSSYSNAMLANSRFDDVALQKSTFSNVNLADVTFDDVNLANASISNANLAGMTINGVLVDDMLRAYRSRELAGGAVLYAVNLGQMQQFYQQLFGFEITHAEEGHAVLQSQVFQLVIVRVPPTVAATIEISNPPQLRAEQPTKLVFRVNSIASVRAIARENGGHVLAAEREWDFQGSCVCDGNDPEGNVFQVREIR